MTVGGNYYALSDRPRVSVQTPFSPTPLSFPIVDQTSIGGPMRCDPAGLYLRASPTESRRPRKVCAQRADVHRTRLDIKMNVAEIYVLVLRRQWSDVVEAKEVSLGGHNKDVTNLFDKGLVSRNDLLARRSRGPIPGSSRCRPATVCASRRPLTIALGER